MILSAKQKRDYIFYKKRNKFKETPVPQKGIWTTLFRDTTRLPNLILMQNLCHIGKKRLAEGGRERQQKKGLFEKQEACRNENFLLSRHAQRAPPPHTEAAGLKSAHFIKNTPKTCSTANLVGIERTLYGSLNLRSLSKKNINHFCSNECKHYSRYFE